MGKIEHLLDEIQRLDQETTKGPWDLNEVMNFDYLIHNDEREEVAEAWGEPNAEFIALARTALPQLANVLRAVLNECDEMDAVYEPAGDSIRQAITDAMEGANSA